MNEPILVRQKVRFILSALPKNRPWTREEFLVDQLNRYLPSRVTVDELRTALEWNQARGYIEYRRNSDEECEEWFLTDSGRHKEGLT
jgi:hypothetical protein